MKRLLLTATLFALALSEAGSYAQGTEKISLDGKWTLDYWEQGRTPVMEPSQLKDVEFKTIEATVPGNVELDLYAAGVIPNPEIGSNVYEIRYLEGWQWRYSRSFETPSFGPEDCVELAFEGIDCFAEIFVNSKKVGSAANMLIPHRYDVSDCLKTDGTPNTVEVIIRSSVAEGRKFIPPTFSNNWNRPETPYMRRAPHSYGWDIMPRLVSAGLWRSVSLDVVHPVHFMDVHWMTDNINLEEKKATVMVDYTISLPVKYQENYVTAQVELSRNGKVVYEDSRAVAMHAHRLIFTLENADFWWPRGYGDPALYEARVRLTGPDGKILDENVQHIGVRTIQLDHTAVNTKEKPGRFCFIVNGIPVFIHGSNWTPMDALHSRDPEHLEKTMALAVDLNCNMLRCWGGNVYEDTAFYDLCDSNGIMIWQDFTMGCSFYPQTAEFQLVLDDELHQIVRKLRNHACIALWAGNNEDDEMMTGVFKTYKVDPNRDVVSRITIPNALFELDPTREYLPSSPWWSEEATENYYSTDILPERHLWGPRGYYKDPFYTTEATCLFASETGYHGMPCRSSIEKMFPKESWYPWTDKVNFHWKDDWICKSVSEYRAYGYYHDRNDLMINQIRKLFGKVPSDLDEFISASQSVQAEAMKFFVERFRGNKFAPKTGIIWWNVRDGWPIISDAVVDWYFQPKMAYYFLRNVQKNVCAMILDPEDGICPLVVSNDTLEPCEGEVTVKDVASGKVLYSGKYRVDANSRSVVTGIPVPSGQGMLLISYTGQGKEKLRNHYLYGEPPFSLDSYRQWLRKTGILDNTQSIAF